MSPEEWQTVSAALDQLLELPDTERAPFLARLRAEQPALCREVESLLREQNPTGRLEAPPAQLLEALRPSEQGSATPWSARRATPPRLPEIAGYEVIEVLGSGGMGVVYKARQLALNRLVALKMIRFGAQAEEEDLARFRTEAEAVAQLRHPNVVQIYEVGQKDGQPYFSLEYVAGGGLDRFLNGAPQAPVLAAEVVTQLAGAMHFAHTQGIVHRDLKPANILLEEGLTQSSPGARDQTELTARDSPFAGRPGVRSFTPRITDFGLAKCLHTDSGQTQTGAIMGTPSYMAPEQAAGKKDIGPTADIYALGAILYEMLTGRPPFRGTTPHDTLLQVQRDEPVPPSRLQPRVPRDLETICLKCLEKERARRYATAADLADDLRRFLRHEPILSRPIGTAERLWRWARRNPRDAGWIAATLVLFVTGLVVALTLWQLAESRRVAAELARAQIQGERDAADESARQALAAVRESFTLATEHPFFQADGMTPARKLLLETALRYLREFVARRADDAFLRTEVADAHERIARITSLLGTRPDAIAYYETARTEYERLLRDRPGDAAIETRLARVEAAIAELTGEAGRVPEAVVLFRQAIVRQQALFDADPTNGERRQDLAISWHKLGALQHGARRADEALASLQNCRELMRPLVTSAPTVMAQSIQAACLASMGQVFLDRLRLAEADQALREALALREQLLEEHPSTGERRELAIIQGTLALVCDERGDRDGALTYLQSAAALRVKVAGANPNVHQYQLDLALSYLRLANEWQRRQQPERALDYQNQALACCERAVAADANAPEYQRRLGECHWELHHTFRKLNQQDKAETHLKKAEEAFARVVALAPGVAFHQYPLATTLLSRAELARNASRWAEAQETYHQAREIFEALRQGDPTNAEFGRKVTIIDANLAYILQETGQLEDAFRTMLDVLRERKLLAARHPDVATFRTDLNKVRTDLAGLARNLATSIVASPAALPADQALVAARRVRQLLETAAHSHPEIPAFASELSRIDSFLEKLDKH